MRALAIDLGTANTLVYVPERGIVLNEPTVLAMNERTGQVLAMGEEAWVAVAEAPESIVAVRPLRHGTITDFDLTERLVRLVLARVGLGRFAHPKAIVTVSGASSAVERRAIEEATLAAGARAVALIDQPMAAALGADLPVEEPEGLCVVDVGGGTTQVAVISMGSVVASRAVRVGGFDLDDAVQRFLRREHGLAVGERTAEAIKREVGSAHPIDDEPAAEIRGRDLASGRPKTVTVTAGRVRAALGDVVGQVVDAVRGAVADAPPELAHDVADRGITLTGGSALLRGLDARIASDTGIGVGVTSAPLETVVTGAGRALASFDRLRRDGILLAQGGR